MNDYRPIIQVNPQLDRTLVSFQANRKLSFFSWLKYKEAFSAKLVGHVIDLYGKEGGVLLDPFAGIGTSLFVGRSTGMNSIGIELMPVGFHAMDARLSAESVEPKAFRRKVADVGRTNWEGEYDRQFALRHISITSGAFPKATDRAIAGYRAFCRRRIRDPNLRKLFELAGLAVLESVSYTRKDGQYLRWDHRANKPRTTSTFDKGAILGFDEAINHKLLQISEDVRHLHQGDLLLWGPQDSVAQGDLDIRKGSCLEVLPSLPAASIDLVVTSPPYCNRYDYTRTYALELVYLGLDADDVKHLRQSLLSCTVENRDKIEYLLRLYDRVGRQRDFEQVHNAFRQQAALQEVLSFLEQRGKQRRLNNANIPRMVRNYFLEMCFVVFELARLLKRGGRVVMVNDNVRYAGEEVPVDLILSDFAQCFGLEVEQIWTLPRGKGNSSQQMGAHGRSELRKCVYVWRKI